MSHVRKEDEWIRKITIGTNSSLLKEQTCELEIYEE